MSKKNTALKKEKREQGSRTRYAVFYRVSIML